MIAKFSQNVNFLELDDFFIQNKIVSNGHAASSEDDCILFMAQNSYKNTENSQKLDDFDNFLKFLPPNLPKVPLRVIQAKNVA